MVVGNERDVGAENSTCCLDGRRLGQSALSRCCEWKKVIGNDPSKQGCCLLINENTTPYHTTPRPTNTKI